MAATGESVVEWQVTVSGDTAATVATVALTPAGSTGGPTVGDPISPAGASPIAGGIQILPPGATTASLTVSAKRGETTITATGTAQAGSCGGSSQSTVDYSRQCDGSLLVILRNASGATSDAQLTITAQGGGRTFTEASTVVAGDEKFVSIAADQIGSVRVTSTKDGSLVSTPPNLPVPATCERDDPNDPENVGDGEGNARPGNAGGGPAPAADPTAAGPVAPPAPVDSSRPARAAGDLPTTGMSGQTAGALLTTSIIGVLAIGVGLGFIIWSRRQRPAMAIAGGPATVANRNGGQRTASIASDDVVATKQPAEPSAPERSLTESRDTDSPDTDSPDAQPPTAQRPETEPPAPGQPKSSDPTVE